MKFSWTGTPHKVFRYAVLINAFKISTVVAVIYSLLRTIALFNEITCNVFLLEALLAFVSFFIFISLILIENHKVKYVVNTEMVKMLYKWNSNVEIRLDNIIKVTCIDSLKVYKTIGVVDLVIEVPDKIDYERNDAYTLYAIPFEVGKKIEGMVKHR